MQRRQRGTNLGILLLATQIFRVGFDRIPPVTLAAIIGQVVIYLRLLDIDWPDINDVCVSSAHVWYYGDWKRCLFAAFFHLDDWHLYYNMVSFMWKGMTLEKHYGSTYFAVLIAMFAVLTNLVMVGLNVGMEKYTGQSWYTLQCAAGFSGVIFALKVLSTYQLPAGIQYIMGWFPVPSRYAVWAELVVIQILVPNASFTGHLAGILVGLMYVKGPLGAMMEGFFSMFTGYSVGSRGSQTYRTDGGHRAYYNQSGTSGRRENTGYQNQYQQYQRAEPTAPPADDHEYHPRSPRVYPDLNQANINQNQANPPYPRHDQGGMPQPPPDMDRMRRTRLNRFAKCRENRTRVKNKPAPYKLVFRPTSIKKNPANKS